MTNQYELLLQMLQLLEQLVDTATSLNDTVKTSFVEKDLVPLQERQREILSNLSALDALIKKQPDNEADLSIKELKKDIEIKLNKFQKINNEFLEHVSSHYRLIGEKKPPL